MVTAHPDQPAVGTEIWSNRPAIVVSNNVLNSRAGFAQVIYLSTAARKRSGPMHIPVTNPNGQPSMALCEQIHTVDASRLKFKIGTVSAPEMKDVEAAITLSLSIGRNPDTHTVFRKWEEHIKLHGIDLAQEIQALSGDTVDQRVRALTHALELITVERDAYRNLYETAQGLPSAMQDVVETMKRPVSHGKTQRAS